MDQPAIEMLYLETILTAFSQAESLETDVADKKEQAKLKLKERAV